MIIDGFDLITGFVLQDEAELAILEVSAYKYLAAVEANLGFGYGVGIGESYGF